MSSNNFYVHLPSNNLTDIYGNTLGNYISQLKHTIVLDGDWEVALTEISYTMSWYNVREESHCSVIGLDDRLHEINYLERDVSTMYESAYDPELKFSTPKRPLTDPGDNHLLEESTSEDLTLVENIGATLLYRKPIRAGFYTTKELIDYLNNMLTHETMTREKDSYLNAPQLELGRGGYVALMTGRRKRPDSNRMEDTMVNITGDASDILGLGGITDTAFTEIATNFGKKFKQTSSTFAEPRGGRYRLFIYTDIIRSIHVGDTMSNLLRMVEIPNHGEFGDQISFRYERPEYKRLASNQISSIQVYIKDDSGADVPFEFGRTIVTLHFRKIK